MMVAYDVKCMMHVTTPSLDEYSISHLWRRTISFTRDSHMPTQSVRFLSACQNGVRILSITSWEMSPTFSTRRESSPRYTVTILHCLLYLHALSTTLAINILHSDSLHGTVSFTFALLTSSMCRAEPAYFFWRSAIVSCTISYMRTGTLSTLSWDCRRVSVRRVSTIDCIYSIELRKLVLIALYSLVRSARSKSDLITMSGVLSSCETCHTKPRRCE